MNRSLVALIAILASSLAFAGEPRYENLLLSDVKEDGKPRGVYAKDTAQIFLSAKLVDVPAGAKLKSDWIAVKTGGVAPDNYKIDSVELNVGPNMNKANFSFSKPTAGWPVGDYRVDLFINGKKAKSVPFQVK